MDVGRGYMGKKICNECHKTLTMGEKASSIYTCRHCGSEWYLVPLFANDTSGWHCEKITGDDYVMCRHLTIDSWIRRAVYYVDNPVS